MSENNEYWEQIISDLHKLPIDPFIDGGYEEEFLSKSVVMDTNGILKLNLSTDIGDNLFTLYDGNHIIGVIIFNKENKNHIDFVGTINGNIDDIDDDKYKEVFTEIFYGVNKENYKGISSLGKKLFELYFNELESGIFIELTSLEDSFSFYTKIFNEFENDGIIEIVKSGIQDFTIKIL